MQNLDHKHILVTASVKNPPRSEEFIIDWLRRLIAAVDMKIVSGPYAKYVTTAGNEGLTAIVSIETSHSSIHVWSEEEIPFIKFDLYSCKTFDPSVPLSFINEFEPHSFEWILLDRNSGINEIARGKG